jgi:hypothetical protein
MDPTELAKRLTVVTPCKVKWKDMQGDDKVRHCALCQLNVYNVREMTTPEVEALLSTPGRTCVQVLRRWDGTVVTGDCRQKWKRRKTRARTALRRATTVFAALSALAILAVATVVLFGNNLRVYFGGGAGGALPGDPSSYSAHPPPPQATFGTSVPEQPEPQP